VARPHAAERQVRQMGRSVTTSRNMLSRGARVNRPPLSFRYVFVVYHPVLYSLNRCAPENDVPSTHC
jgi:hypothetical protein